MATFLIVLFLIVCVLLVGVVLLQKGRGGGLGSAFGGGAGSSAFGTRTGDVFTWVTIVLTAVFLGLAVLGALVVRPPAQQVQTPVLDPPSWPIDEDGTVSMRCPGTKGATIRYTINSKEPSEKSTIYRVPIRISEGDHVQVRAYRAGMKQSPLVSVKYEKLVPKAAPADLPKLPVEKSAPTPAMMTEPASK